MSMTQKPLNKLAIIRKMNNPHSLYIHIPFCNKICDYCDFVKLQYFRKFAISYLEALKKELESYRIKGLNTIYVGGGTPTALEDDLFEELLKIIKPYSDGVKEYTFEANPESLSESKIRLLKEHGVNRISLGVQSTDSKVLKAINREHDYDDVKRAINCLQQYGIDNINVDLILGLPHSSKSLLLKDLENLTSLGIKHISCYGLTIHPHTVLYNQGFKELEDDKMRELYDLVHNYLKDKGFVHYEVSNWAKEGFESLHNMTYWRNEQYYGCGLGAAGYIGEVRYKNTTNLDKYLKGEYILEKEELTIKDKYNYEIMLVLRCIHAGLNFNKIKEEYGVDLTQKMDSIEKFINEGYLSLSNGVVYPTYEGMMILDAIILELIK